MIEIQEEKTNDEVNSISQTIDDEWRKYNKRMDGMIDDAEIEAEIEAEKKIRYKNSKLFTISITGIVLLTLIFINVQQHSSMPQITIDKKPLYEKTLFSAKKTFPLNSQADQLTPLSTTPMTKLAKVSKKSKNLSSRVKGISTQNKDGIEKTSKSISVKQKINVSDGKHYVQLGAFSIKKNAKKFSNQVNVEGFNTVIFVRDTKSTEKKTYIVRIEGIETTNEAQKIRQQLVNQGFKNSFIR